MAKEILIMSGVILVTMISIPIDSGIGILEGNLSEKSQIAVSRDLPTTAIQGEYFNVSLIINVDETNQVNGFLIKETIPFNWIIISSTAKFSFDNKTGVTTWVLFGSDLVDRTVTYIVQVPATTTGNATFSGRILFSNNSGNTVNYSISGDTTVEVVKVNTAATANRTLPDKANAGSRINVSISIDVNESNKPSAVIVKDYFPILWNATVSSPAANSISRIDREIKWILTGEQVFDRVISYMVEIPAGELGNRTFSGEVIYNDPSDNPITVVTEGDSVISVEKQCVVKGDFNCDDKVSDFEILDYVSKWVKGEVSDFDLLEAINNWAKE